MSKEEKEEKEEMEEREATGMEEVLSSSSVTRRQSAELLDFAVCRKVDGNEFFKEKEYTLAIDSYSRAIEVCPKEEKNYDNLAIFYGNRAACYCNLEEYDQALEDCAKSLEFKQDYVKVLIRRCQIFEKVDKFEEALVDARNVKEIDPTYPAIEKLIHRLDVANKERTEKLKEEAMGKLKELGNSILGNFGMSLDNFKLQQDPNTGSYNISMNNS